MGSSRQNKWARTLPGSRPQRPSAAVCFRAQQQRQRASPAMHDMHVYMNINMYPHTQAHIHKHTHNREGKCDREQKSQEGRRHAHTQTHTCKPKTGMVSHLSHADTQIIPQTHTSAIAGLLSHSVTHILTYTEVLAFKNIYTEGEKASYRNRDRYRYSDRETLSHSQGKHRKRAIKNRRRGFRSAIEGGGKGGGGLGGRLGDGGLARGAALPRAFNCQRQKLSQVSALVLVLCPVTT